MSDVTHSGQAASAETITLSDRTVSLKLISVGGVATVTLNRGKVISLPASMVAYEEIYGSYDHFTVSSGTVDYIAFG